jgi:anti-sigma regulatory factor (Ser/Thr protein kinase)
VELYGAILQTRHLIDEETKVGEARRQSSELARRHGLDPATVGRVALATTELATNLLRHGGGGELLVQPISRSGTNLIELIAIDRGKGMHDIERCLSDGYSTAGSSGTGLGAVRRLAAEFDIYSLAGEGTVVLARIGAESQIALRNRINFGAVSVPVEGESVCGDSWRIALDGGATAVMLADGLGHGILAADAAQTAVAAFESGPFDEPSEVLQRAHRAAAGSRGAAAACARLGMDGEVMYAGVGNISGSVVSDERARGMVSHGGTLGLRMPRLQQFDYQRKPQSLVIMHSDGISARWDLRLRPGLLQRHPAIIAAVLYRDHARGRDDATVVVTS